MSISAKIIADSIANGIRLPTLELRAPKFIDAEFEKHRMLSSNSSSDRAIPLLKLLDSGYYLPEDIRLNQPGMSGDLLLDEDSKEEFWEDLKILHGYTSDILKKWSRVHKQHLNRYLLGFSWQKKIVTATEWDNFFKLRLHKDAQPEMMVLAEHMQAAMDSSVPVALTHGEWHLPLSMEGDLLTKIKTSVAGAARISYNNHDGSNRTIEKDINLHNQLLISGHMSPFEHVATPMNSIHYTECEQRWEKGVTHTDLMSRQWSGNFRGWIMYRALLDG